MLFAVWGLFVGLEDGCWLGGRAEVQRLRHPSINTFLDISKREGRRCADVDDRHEQAEKYSGSLCLTHCLLAGTKGTAKVLNVLVDGLRNGGYVQDCEGPQWGQ